MPNESECVNLMPNLAHDSEDEAESKDPGPEGPALISPQRGGVYLDSEWNDGMVELWNIGNQNRMMV